MERGLHYLEIAFPLHCYQSLKLVGFSYEINDISTTFFQVFAEPAVNFCLTFQESLVLARMYHTLLPGSWNSLSTTIELAFVKYLL